MPSPLSEKQIYSLPAKQILQIFFLSCSLSRCLNWSLLSSRSCNRSVLSNNVNWNLNLNLLVVVYSSLVLTNLLSILHSDDLAINLDALLSELLSNSCSIN